MTSGSGLTVLPGVPDSSQARPGMAFYEGSGPPGKTCGTCGFKLDGRCAMYRRLSAGRAGPVVKETYQACKYYEDRKR